MIVTVQEKGRAIEIEDVVSIRLSGPWFTLTFTDGSVDEVYINKFVEVRHA